MIESEQLFDWLQELWTAIENNEKVKIKNKPEWFFEAQLKLDGEEYESYDDDDHIEFTLEVFESNAVQELHEYTLDVKLGQIEFEVAAISNIIWGDYRHMAENCDEDEVLTFLAALRMKYLT